MLIASVLYPGGDYESIARCIELFGGALYKARD
jgi:hypothetical protein